MTAFPAAPPSRIGELPTLPVFLKLRGRPVLLAGATEPAVWKAELLAAAGAVVLVCDPAPCPAMLRLAETSGGLVRVEHRGWQASDLAGAALAIGALEADEGASLRDAARRAGVPVNIVDRPALCDFQFGTIVDRSPLVIAISTDGAAPVFGQALRARIEAMLPNGIAAWAQAAKVWRDSLQPLDLGFAARRRFWEAFAERALDGSEAGPEDGDRLAFLDAAVEASSELSGRIDCVGLGGGTAQGLSLAAIGALQSAEVIVVGTDVDPRLLQLGRREALRVAEPGSDALPEMLADLIGGGKRVALTGLGDPARCDRWHGRLASLAKVGPGFVRIPGSNCPTCHRDCAIRSLVSGRA